ncbi:MAG: hypothetical protein AB7O96_05430 [Pseudobdellovibrionaceae bacterium]
MKATVDLQRTAEPAWSQKVERWYQLDETAYGFCEALHQWEYLKDLKKPDVILLALEGASNLADVDFVQTGASSPAKFVYTLPNICVSVIFQMLGTSGKVYCLNQGATTYKFAKTEAEYFAKSGKTVWFFSSSYKINGESREFEFEAFDFYEAHPS